MTGYQHTYSINKTSRYTKILTGSGGIAKPSPITTSSSLQTTARLRQQISRLKSSGRRLKSAWLHSDLNQSFERKKAALFAFRHTDDYELVASGTGKEFARAIEHKKPRPEPVQPKHSESIADGFQTLPEIQWDLPSVPAGTSYRHPSTPATDFLNAISQSSFSPSFQTQSQTAMYLNSSPPALNYSTSAIAETNSCTLHTSSCFDPPKAYSTSNPYSSFQPIEPPQYRIEVTKTVKQTVSTAKS